MAPDKNFRAQVKKKNYIKFKKIVIGWQNKCETVIFTFFTDLETF